MLTLYKPNYEDLRFRQLLLADEETMSYNHAWGGTISWPEEAWKGWYDYWIENPEGMRCYRYLKSEDGTFVGEIAWHFSEDEGKHLANVIVLAKYRGKGYGSEALRLLCDAAKENGISELYDDIAVDNPAIPLFLKQGFTEEYRTEEKVYLRKSL